MGHLHSGGVVHRETATQRVAGEAAARDDGASAQLTFDAALGAGVRLHPLADSWADDANPRDLDAQGRQLRPDTEDGVRSSGSEADAAIAASGTTRRAALLTPRDIEAVLRLGRTMTYELLRSGEIPSLRIGRVIRVTPAALEQWIAERSRGAG